MDIYQAITVLLIIYLIIVIYKKNHEIEDMRYDNANLKKYINQLKQALKPKE